MDKKAVFGITAICGIIYCLSAPADDLVPTNHDEFKRHPPERKRRPPKVGPQRQRTDDEQIGGWYSCARDAINSYLDKHQPTLPESYCSAFSFLLKSDGTLSDLKVLSSSGPAELDHALLDAIQQSFPVKEKFNYSTINELVRNRNIRMDFSRSEHPTCRFKIIEGKPAGAKGIES
jgi:hypothetical protein